LGNPTKVRLLQEPRASIRVVLVEPTAQVEGSHGAIIAPDALAARAAGVSRRSSSSTESHLETSVRVVGGTRHPRCSRNGKVFARSWNTGCTARVCDACPSVSQGNTKSESAAWSTADAMMLTSISAWTKSIASGTWANVTSHCLSVKWRKRARPSVFKECHAYRRSYHPP